MFGVVSARPFAPQVFLKDAERSLRALSTEHPDGWGVAIRTERDWLVHRETTCAARCGRYDEVIAGVQSRLVIAHVRKKTVGPTSIANTHPFRHGDFVFAHNGTVKDIARLEAGTSAVRRAEIVGDTDSERLFAFVLTHIDAAGGDVARGVAAAVGVLHDLDDPGSASFLMSCGARLYAHRLGRSLFSLSQPDSVAVASEPLTDGAWREMPERTLVVLDAAAAPPVHALAA